MKLKIKNPAALAVAAGVSPPPPTATTGDIPEGSSQPAKPKLHVKISKAAAADPPSADPTKPAPGQAADAPKPKRKYTKKAKLDENGQPLPPASKGAVKSMKRARDDNGEDGSPAPKRKPKPTAKSLALARDDDSEEDASLEVRMNPVPQGGHPGRTPSVKLSLKPKALPGAPKRTDTTILKVRGAGKPPPRPPGQGYDSEAEEAEGDPAIEAQFILRMPPGPDCDILRKAIEEKTIGKPVSAGGPGVYFRFLEREGRRAMITIGANTYAASMVDLPCVIESLKSWNKRDWVKTADVCQMLLVLGRVSSEDEARTYPRSRDVEDKTHRYPHGLTPPMQHVRQRRFKLRKSYQHFEEVERIAKTINDNDDRAVEDGGSVSYDLLDGDHDTDGSTDAEGEDEDENEEISNGTPAEEPIDEDVLKKMMQDVFDKEAEVDLDVDAEGDLDDLFGDDQSAMVEVDVAATPHDVAMHALTGNAIITAEPEPETVASTPAAVTSPDDDDDDGGESDEDQEEDAEAIMRQQQVEQTRAEISELEQAIQTNVQAYEQQKNKLMKGRIQIKITKLQTDRAIKLKSIGEGED
ncbi:TAFII55 protein conserved region-domain-containing protein [Massariosphaeria phaeospora]|uniref:TAFII55 protein conserved region-domain-containing protein n=1 Tax=Massariosphaeria phaeospora TaxID=100035 RepID=A0A7C8I6C1_9PLEO|nr:TAFII55 protein conserved region-domain-containing protein [Massariosphaeria phaeospora]